MLDADFAYTHARFTDTGNPIGSFIPEAPAVVASAGITLGEDLGWFGELFSDLGDPTVMSQAWR